jgi:hypothetical protein
VVPCGAPGSGRAAGTASAAARFGLLSQLASGRLIYNRGMIEPVQAMRLDDTISFEVPTTEDAAERYYADPSLSNAEALVAPDLLEAARQAVGSDAEVRAVGASVGRGASAYGAAVQLVGALIAYGGVNAGVRALASDAKKARDVYRALRARLGYRPNVSLGAAKSLAAADLADRLHHTDFQLLGCGDTNSTPPDQSFTGDDTFWVFFLDHPDLHVYVVAANGRVHYMGRHEMRAGRGSRLALFPGPNGRTARPDIEDDEGDSYDGLV